MKKSIKLVSGVVVAVIAIITGVIVYSIVTKPEVTEYTGAKKEKSYQGKLDVVSPAAYGDISDLNLKKGTYISVIGQNASGAFWEQVKDGVKQAEEDINKNLGYKGDDKVKVEYNGPSADNPVDEQINILDEELSRYPSAVGISTIDASACEVQFGLASDNGIPIVSFDAGSDYKNIQSLIATDNKEAATTAASKLCDEMADQGQMILLIKDSVSTTSKDREQAVLEEVKANHPNIQIVKIYHLDEQKEMARELLGIQMQSKEDKDKYLTEEEENERTKKEKEQNAQIAAVTQEDIVQYILKTNPQVTGIFASNAVTTTLAVDACEQQKKSDMKIVGFDGGETQVSYIADGKVSGLILQNPFGMGYATVVAAARATLNLGNEAFVNTSYTWVNKDNIKQTNIKNMLY